VAASARTCLRRPAAVPASAGTLLSKLDELTWNLRAWLDAMNVDADSHGGVGTSVTSLGIVIADIEARLHDSASAELTLADDESRSDRPKHRRDDPFRARPIGSGSRGRLTRATEMEAFGTAYADPIVSSNSPGYSCWIAPAEEAARHPDKADAGTQDGGTFVDCYRFQADILDGRGDWAARQKVYADSVALAPDLPAGYYSWGVALARHGDLKGAETKLKDANQRGHTGLIRSRHGAMCSQSWARAKMRSRSTTRRSNTRRTGRH